jgi:hypothetical protein
MEKIIFTSEELFLHTDEVIAEKLIKKTGRAFIKASSKKHGGA